MSRWAERFRRIEARVVRALTAARTRTAPLWDGARRRSAPFRARSGAWIRERWRPVRSLLWPPETKHLLIALAVSAVVLLIVWERCGLTGCPDVDRLGAYQPDGAPVVLDRTGSEIARLAPFNRELVSLADLPEHVKDAFMAVEDQRFYEHGAVDWRRAGGSVLANLRAGGIAEGFSTITMQLARNVFPERLPGAERTPRRKLLEVRVAGDIEDRFTKDEILELYLNHIYFGGALRGIDAAARSYFGKPASDLTISEAATLAAMPKAPNSYNPREDREAARERRNLVLGLMAEQGRITAEQAENARESPIRTRRERPLPEAAPPPAPYFVRAIRRILEDRMGDGLYSSPIRIHTTLDLSAQAAAERALDRQLRAIETGAYGRYGGPRRYGQADAVDEEGTRYLQGAIVVIEADSGDVLALIGGRDYEDSPFDRAIGARRQVGSAFKPFVYAAALEDGYSPSQHLIDEPLKMELAGGEVWEPQNFEGTYQGEMTLREAVVRSNNVATVRLALAVGLDEVRATARDMGVRSDLPDLPSLALGTAGLSLLELTTAYVPLTASGRRVEPRLVRRVEDPDGKMIWDNRPNRTEVLDDGVAWMVTDLLRDAVRRGTATAVREAGFREPAAGKTGTTNDGHDAWFVGYTPDLVGGVWIGFDRPEPIVARASGGRLAAPIWARMMSEIYRERSTPEPWARPDDVVERDVDPPTGLILADGCRPLEGRPRSEVFLESDLPARVCPAGEEEDRGFLARVASAVGRFFGRVGGFIAGIFDGEDDEEEAERLARERYLGRPRLPREAEVNTRLIPDTLRMGEPLGTPLDSMPEGFGDEPVIIDTIRMDPDPGPDTIRLDPDRVEPPTPEPGDTIILLRPDSAPPPVDTGGA
ncbi:MAG: PBP1A family penicillin-binding protein [Gemmatimonadetes bacterium]|nr:PBP1A family penicillin-binding protein [Gemmatimonadota bacterium]